MRIEAQKTRLEAGKAVPMTPAEREYYNVLCIKGTKGECRSFLKLRLNIIKCEARFPDGARLAVIYYPTNHQVRVVPEEQLDDTLIRPNARVMRYIKGKLEILPLVTENK